MVGNQAVTGSNIQNNEVLQQLPEPAYCFAIWSRAAVPGAAAAVTLLLTLLHLLPMLLLSCGKRGGR
jgi:hypothetical protein